jgi:hypothetical protein
MHKGPLASVGFGCQTKGYSNTSARTGSARACARDRQNRHSNFKVYPKEVFSELFTTLSTISKNTYYYAFEPPNRVILKGFI